MYNYEKPIFINKRYVADPRIAKGKIYYCKKLKDKAWPLDDDEIIYLPCVRSVN